MIEYCGVHKRILATAVWKPGRQKSDQEDHEWYLPGMCERVAESRDSALAIDSSMGQNSDVDFTHTQAWDKEFAEVPSHPR